MHSMRPRPICRAHNSFSPSAALWQYFVALNQHLPRRPLQSLFTTEATQSRDIDNVSPSEDEPLAESVPDSSQDATLPKVLVRKTWPKERSFVPNSKLSPNPRLLGENTAPLNRREEKRDTTPYRGENGQDVEKLLLKAHAAFDTSQDYVGVVVRPVHSEPIHETQFPWVIRQRENINTGRERLNLEIQKFHEYIRPTPVESVARRHVIEQVRHHVRQCLPDHILEVFGSERTGMAFAKSDIDLRLVSEKVYSNTTQTSLPPKPSERIEMKTDLWKLHQHLYKTCKPSYLLSALRWARYPLITLQDRASGLDLQIVLANDTSLSRQFMQRYMEENPCLDQVYSVIKSTLDVRGLSDVFRGGIGSYTLFMMIVASLKHRPSVPDNAAGALLSFLTFWSKFQTEAHGLSIEPPEYLVKLNPIMNDAAKSRIAQGINAPLPPWMLNFRDPADETNDLGRKIVAWKHIQKTFASLARRLRADLKNNTRPSLLTQLVGPVYGLEKTQRKRLSEYGNSLSKAGRQHTPSEAFEQTVENPDATVDGPAPSHLADFEAVAMSIKSGRSVKKLTDAEALEKAMEAGQHDDKGGVHSWLKDIEQVSEHKETSKAFSDILGLNKTARK